MVERLLLSTLVGAAFAIGVAKAADVPPMPPITAPVYNWTGLYVGADLGGGWSKGSTDYAFSGTPIAGGSGSSNAFSSIVGGTRAGYNLQTGGWVFGFEADVPTAREGGSRAASSGCVSGSCAGLAQSFGEQLPWFGTVRGRVGLTPASGWLFYATGGLAYGPLLADGSAVPAAPLGFSSDTNVGWTLGVGVEAALAGDWTWKLEYLYLKPEDANHVVSVPGFTFTANGHAYDNLVRAGLNYRFGWDGPVIGK